MKKIILKIFIIFLFGFLFAENIFAEGVNNVNCKFSENNISQSIESCVKNTGVYSPESSDLKVDSGFKLAIGKIIIKISLYLGILAVGAIVYAAFMLTISAGDNEKIQKGKKILQWAILGLLGVMFAATIITLIINLFYGK